MKKHVLIALFAIVPAIAMGAAAVHSWCGSIEPGKGLRSVRVGHYDRMCGFIQAKADGPHKFTSTVKGTRIWIGNQLVVGSVPLKAESLYAILIEAPASKDFRLSWDQPLGIPMEIPPIVLFQPTLTVVPGCAMPGDRK